MNPVHVCMIILALAGPETGAPAATAAAGAAIQEADRLATVAYLRVLQSADGGFPPGIGMPSDLASTSAALRALRYLGELPHDLPGCRTYLRRCFARIGERRGFGPRPDAQADVRSTAFGLMALEAMGRPDRALVSAGINFLEEHAMTFEDIRLAAAAFEALKRQPRTAGKWSDAIRKMQNVDSTFGKDGSAAFESGGAIVALLRLGMSAEDAKTGPLVAALKSGQRADGGFSAGADRPSDLSATYRVMRAFHMLGLQPDTAKLRSFVASCRNTDGGYGSMPRQPSTVANTYYALSVLVWLM